MGVGKTAVANNIRQPKHLSVHADLLLRTSTYVALVPGLGGGMDKLLKKLVESLSGMLVGDVGGNAKGPKLTAARPAAKVWFAVDVEAYAEPTAGPTKQDQRAPINMVSGRAWSPGIYQALRLLGKSLDVAWERVFIHLLTFN